MFRPPEGAPDQPQIADGSKRTQVSARLRRMLERERSVRAASGLRRDLANEKPSQERGEKVFKSTNAPTPIG